MSRELSDDDPEKWSYSEHARAKHAIQWTYLGAWLPILGTRHEKLLLFDGFAGRGRYTSGEDGSPILFWKRAVEAVGNGRPNEVSIRCVELNANNYQDLSARVASLSHPRVQIEAENGSFADVAEREVGHLASLGRTAPPAFWTADPFGFKGVSLHTVRKIMSLPRSEILITFMVRDMRRFLEQDNFEAPLSEFFGGEAWRDCLRQEGTSREECLLLRYSELVRQGVAEFATPFRVFEDERRQTLYYLVHLSNHALGMREMKEAMINESPDMTFWPVTLRPPDQLALDVREEEPFPSLQRYLADTYTGQDLKFETLLNTDYPMGLWLEAHYRAAILDMEKRDMASVGRDRATPSGRKPRGLKLKDSVKFGAQLTLQ